MSAYFVDVKAQSTKYTMHTSNAYADPCCPFVESLSGSMPLKKIKCRSSCSILDTYPPNCNFNFRPPASSDSATCPETVLESAFPMGGARNTGSSGYSTLWWLTYCKRDPFKKRQHGAAGSPGLVRKSHSRDNGETRKANSGLLPCSRSDLLNIIQGSSQKHSLISM